MKYWIRRCCYCRHLVSVSRKWIWEAQLMNITVTVRWVNYAVKFTTWQIIKSTLLWRWDLLLKVILRENHFVMASMRTRLPRGPERCRNPEVKVNIGTSSLKVSHSFLFVLNSAWFKTISCIYQWVYFSRKVVFVNWNFSMVMVDIWTFCAARADQLRVRKYLI